MGFWASKFCRANRNRCAHHHNYCHKRDLISDYTFACTPKPWWEECEMGCWKMVYLDISSSWFDNSGTIDMGKDERKPMHKLCSTIKFHIIWVAYDMQHITSSKREIIYQTLILSLRLKWELIDVFFSSSWLGYLSYSLRCMDCVSDQV